MNNNKPRFSLSLKVNILIVFIILLVSGGLVYNSYRLYCNRVDSYYLNQAVEAADFVNTNVAPQTVQHMWQIINTDEFRKMRQEAVDTDNEGMIEEYLKNTSAHYIDRMEGYEIAPISFNAYREYRNVHDLLTQTLQFFDITKIHIQYEYDNITYILADPSATLFSFGKVIDEIQAFLDLEDNAQVLPIVYRNNSDWFCTVRYQMILEDANGETVVGVVNVDIDMNEIVAARQKFLVQSAIFVLLQTVLAILISVLLMRRTVIKPLWMLSKASADFAPDGKTLTKDDVIRLPIDSRDEIEDLYHAIQGMQEHIVDYTQNLTRITKNQERVKTELHMAKEIQAAMLPDVFPAFPDHTEFDLYASMTPAREVGGDFYDFFLVDDDHLCVLIADVTDKGVPAALFMMSTMILINYRTRQGGTPAEILMDINEQICRSNTSKMFVTVWMGILDIHTGVMTCTNAGHEYPAIRNADGTFRILKDKHGLVIGGLSHVTYTDYTLKLEPGDAIFVYTDGVPEANDNDGNFYTLERMVEALNRAGQVSPQEILQVIREDVDDFVGDAKQFDDLTMLCLEYKGD